MSSRREDEDTDATTVGTDDDDDDDLDGARPLVLQPTSLAVASSDHPLKPGGVTPRRPITMKSIKQSSSPLGQKAPAVVDLLETDTGDESFNEGEAAYREFKNRKAIKRKRSTANLKNRATKVTRVATANSFVGRFPTSDGKARPRRPLRDYGEEVSSEDELMEYSLPDY
ncbi:hypothetical protein ASPCADRAFT_515412, partial [Aspergillus carbonarius ITEM 5010]